MNPIVPNMRPNEFAVLVEDIQTHGQLNPIVTMDGLILDGRQRWLACRWLGVEPRMVEADEDTRTDPIAYVVSVNMLRQHLTRDQIAAIVVEAEDALEAEARLRCGHGQTQLPLDGV